MAEIEAHPEKINCPYCGKENLLESEFCWACYKNLRVPKETRDEQKLFKSLAGLGGGGVMEPGPVNAASSESFAWILSGPAGALGRFVLVAALFLFYLRWFKIENYFSPLDYLNLAFHEAGHLFLGFFGRFIMMLGGTVFQLLFPAVCAVHLWRRDSRLGWQLCVFWFGESLLNISVYAGDAIKQALPLVGGGEHDWTYLLTATRLIAHTPAAAKVIFLSGSAVIFWSLYLIGRDGEVLLRPKPGK